MKSVYAKVVLGLCFTFTSLWGHAEEEVKLPPLDPSYEGIHPMVLVNKGSAIFAYHMATYDKPNNVQILYKLSVKDIALVQLVRDGDVVTIKPKKFNLQRLMRGEKVVVDADVYIGNFQKEGSDLVYPSMTLNFDKMLYVRELKDLEPSSRKQKYDEVSYNNGSDRIYIHQLQEAPTYDQLLHIDLNAGCRKNFNASSAVPKESELLYKFINCGTLVPMYFETEAFAQP